MKKTFLQFILFVACAGMVFAQSPNAVNYQAVARDGSGVLLNNQTLDVRVGVYSGAGATTLVYEETHSVSTNTYGLFSLKVGGGTVTSGTFMAIDWGGDEHHMKVEVDDGGGYVDLGTSQLVTVPYAFHATTAEKATDLSLNELNNVTLGGMIANGQVLEWNGMQWIAANDDDGQWTTSGSNIYYNTGYVGIGTTTPNQQLSVHTSSGISYIRVSDNTTGPASGLRMGLSGSGNAYIINDESTKSLSLGTEGTTQMRINASGHVGINTTSDDMMLFVRQDVANRGIRTQHQSTTDYWDTGVGTTTKNYKFYYNNLFRADISSVDGAYTMSSDKRLKKDIEYMAPVLDKVNQLDPATYYYIDTENEDAPRSLGFVAQDVEPLFPDLVRTTDNGYKGLVYDGFAVISIKAIQELDQKITEMQMEIEALKDALNK